jgi:coenzyme F420-reducing hydrogenase delta subunit
VKIIRVPCTGRVDLGFIHRAFSNGEDGVFIGGCWPGECHYVTEGNIDALANVHIYRKLLQQIGVRPERLRLEWIAASEGTRYAELMNDFVKELKGLGRLGAGGIEGIDGVALKAKLAAVKRLIPYIKLVERERLRGPVRKEAALSAFYASDETNRLFHDLVADKLALSQIMLLLREGPLSTGQIAETLKLSPSEVSRHMNSSSRQGLVQYDVSRQRYALAF